MTQGPAIPVEFQRAVQTLIEDAKAAGKTKLIVDVSANGGGLIFQGDDTFRQLFPQIQQDGFNRFRSTDLLQIAGRQFSGAIADDFDTEISSNDTLISIYESYQNYRYDLDIANKSFTSVEDKFSPDTFNNDNFTQIHRWNFDDPCMFARNPRVYTEAVLKRFFLVTTINTTYGVVSSALSNLRNFRRLINLHCYRALMSQDMAAGATSPNHLLPRISSFFTMVIVLRLVLSFQSSCVYKVAFDLSRLEGDPHWTRTEMCLSFRTTAVSKG